MRIRDLCNARLQRRLRALKAQFPHAKSWEVTLTTAEVYWNNIHASVFKIVKQGNKLWFQEYDPNNPST